MNKITTMTVALGLLLFLTGCTGSNTNHQPEVTQMQAIGELAVLDLYYHNVAKFDQEDASGILFWKKDKNFWIEYSGMVEVGIDVNQLDLEIKGTNVTITLPPAKVLDVKVDSSSLTKDSFYVDDDSAKISAEDEVYAFSEAQNQLEQTASNDTAVLAEAEQRVAALLEDYVLNLGNTLETEYNVDFIQLEK